MTTVTLKARARHGAERWLQAAPPPPLLPTLFSSLMAACTAKLLDAATHTFSSRAPMALRSAANCSYGRTRSTAAASAPHAACTPRERGLSCKRGGERAPCQALASAQARARPLARSPATKEAHRLRPAARPPRPGRPRGRWRGPPRRAPCARRCTTPPAPRRGCARAERRSGTHKQLRLTRPPPWPTVARSGVAAPSPARRTRRALTLSEGAAALQASERASKRRDATPPRRARTRPGAAPPAPPSRPAPAPPSPPRSAPPPGATRGASQATRTTSSSSGSSSGSSGSSRSGTRAPVRRTAAGARRRARRAAAGARPRPGRRGSPPAPAAAARCPRSCPPSAAAAAADARDEPPQEPQPSGRQASAAGPLARARARLASPHLVQRVADEGGVHRHDAAARVAVAAADEVLLEVLVDGHGLGHAVLHHAPAGGRVELLRRLQKVARVRPQQRLPQRHHRRARAPREPADELPASHPPISIIIIIIISRHAARSVAVQRHVSARTARLRPLLRRPSIRPSTGQQAAAGSVARTYRRAKHRGGCSVWCGSSVGTMYAPTPRARISARSRASAARRAPRSACASASASPSAAASGASSGGGGGGRGRPCCELCCARSPSAPSRSLRLLPPCALIPPRAQRWGRPLLPLLPLPDGDRALWPPARARRAAFLRRAPPIHQAVRPSANQS
eukprot:scaffold2434_cov278-Prasinococcus_capsulatus_cf.AAC.3